MTAFIIKSGVCMILLYGLYWIFLRKEKLFVFNRYFLIISVLFSLSVPFISIPVYMIDGDQSTEIMSAVYGIMDDSQVSSEAVTTISQEGALTGNAIHRASDSPVTVKTKSLKIDQVLLLIYITGFAVMLLRFCRNILMVKRMSGMAEKIDNEWYCIALLNQNINPFSFLRTVYLNKDDYLGERIAPNVLKHELEHVRQLHSRDIIFFELVHIVFWFNPVLFFYKNAARINHEYLADEAVVSDITDTKSYAYELVNFISRKVSVPFTSGFSPSMIRLRLLMLNTSTTRRARNLSMSGVLAASFLLLTALSFRPEYGDPQDHKNKTQITLNKDIVKEEVYFRGPDFSPMPALVVFNGRKLDFTDTLFFDTEEIKVIDVLKDRKARRKYGKSAGDGAVEINTYADKKSKLTDSMVYRQLFTVNNQSLYGKISIPVSNLYSFESWTYPVFPNQATEKQWRTIGMMTRDFYKLQGRVIREDGEPLPGVFVTATDHPTGVRTDKEGRFILEDVKPGAMAELKADGYDPLFFRVTSPLHSMDMRITLEKEGESGKVKNNMSASYIIRDFTGAWKFNRELSKTFFPEGYSITYDIQQFDGDSVHMNITRKIPDVQMDLKQNISFEFNTIKTSGTGTAGGKFVTECSISSDGQSFTVTSIMKSLIGSWEGMKRAETFSLDGNGTKLIIRTYNFKDINSPDGEESEILVFEKI